MENLADDGFFLTDVAALVTAIDAPPPPTATVNEDDNADASLYAPLDAAGDEWWLFDDMFDSRKTPTSPKVVISPSVTSDDSDPKETSTTRVKSCRDRQKAELAYLKARVIELEQELQVLRDASRPAVEDQSLAVSDAVTAFWKRRAEGERRARERSVAENAQLRQSLEAQLKVAKTLDRVLRKRPQSDPPLQSPHDKRHRLHDAQETEIYDFLTQSIDTRYAHVDTVWRECGLSSCHTVFQDARYVEPKTSDARTPWYLEFVDSKVAPFDYALVRDVTWRALLTPTIPFDNNGVYEVVEAVDDLVKADIRIPVRVGNSDVLGRSRFVMRRYTEEMRVVLVWALWSTTEGGMLYDQQIRLIEEGWGVVCPLSQEAGSSYSLLQKCGRMRPNMTIKKGSKLEAHVGILTDMILGTYHDILRGLDDHMGRMMMEEGAARGI